MNCSEIQELLYDFLKKRLGGLEYQKVKDHLDTCKPCQAEVEDLRKDLSLLDKVKVPEISPGFEDRIRKRIEEKPRAAATLVIILQFIHKQLRWKLIRHNGTLIPQPVLSARVLGQKADREKIGTIAKELTGCYVTGDIYGDTEGNVHLYLEVKASLGGNLIPQVAVKLRDGKGDEISSKFSQDGTVSIEELTQDKYSIEVIKEERVIGIIDLDLRG